MNAITDKEYQEGTQEWAITILTLLFPEAKIVKQENGFKFNVKQLNTGHLFRLHDINRLFDVTIKRSGTGLAVCGSRR